MLQAGSIVWQVPRGIVGGNKQATQEIISEGKGGSEGNRPREKHKSLLRTAAVCAAATQQVCSVTVVVRGSSPYTAYSLCPSIVHGQTTVFQYAQVLARFDKIDAQ